MVSIFTSTALIALAISSGVQGHGYIVKPPAQFLPGTGDITQYSATIDSASVYPGVNFNIGSNNNVANFLKEYNKNPASSIKAFINQHQIVKPGATAACGFSDPNAPKVSVANEIYWGKNKDLTGEGYVVGHAGPCETWCDDKMVQTDMTCDLTYNTGNGAARVPLASGCANASRLTHYWIAMHTGEWQVYINCLNLGGSSPPTSPTTMSPTTAKPSSPPPPTMSPTTVKPTTPTPTVPSTTYGVPGNVPTWGQCGGKGYTGPTGCVSGSKCTSYNEWYSQCVPN